MNKKKAGYIATKEVSKIGIELYTLRAVAPIVAHAADAVIPGSGKAIKVVKIVGNAAVCAGIAHGAGEAVEDFFDNCKDLYNAGVLGLKVRKAMKEKSTKEDKKTKKVKKTKKANKTKVKRNTKAIDVEFAVAD